MKRFGQILTGAVIVLAMATASQASTTRAVAGSGSLPDGRSLMISVQDATGGTAWLYRNEPVGSLQINLSCVEVTDDIALYPIPTPFHSFSASGVGSDGQTYYVTIFDWTAGHPDQAAISTIAGPQGTCHGPAGTAPLTNGDFVIV